MNATNDKGTNAIKSEGANGAKIGKEEPEGECELKYPHSYQKKVKRKYFSCMKKKAISQPSVQENFTEKSLNRRRNQIYE